jgi:hypothetical protein
MLLDCGHDWIQTRDEMCCCDEKFVTLGPEQKKGACKCYDAKIHLIAHSIHGELLF